MMFVSITTSMPLNMPKVLHELCQPNMSLYVIFFHENRNQSFAFASNLSMVPRVVMTTLFIHDLENFHQTNDNLPYETGDLNLQSIS